MELLRKFSMYMITIYNVHVSHNVCFGSFFFSGLLCSLIPFKQLGYVGTDKNSVHLGSLEGKSCSQFFSPPSFSIWARQMENPSWSPVTAAIWKFSLLAARRPTTPWRRTPPGRWMQTSPGSNLTNPTDSSQATRSMRSMRFCFC